MTPPRGIHHKLDDQDYPAYTMGLAAELLGVQPAFLRSLDAAGLLTPGRSAGGQRRYSRAELTLANKSAHYSTKTCHSRRRSASSASNTNSPQPTNASPNSNAPPTNP
jgi:hypothetical protein